MISVQSPTQSSVPIDRPFTIRKADGAFFADYLEKYSQSQEAPSGKRDDATLSGLVGGDLLTLLQEIPDIPYTRNDLDTFADILARAYRSDAMEDPLAFLHSLRDEELAILQHVQALADPIDPSTLTKEGASNLLTPRGYKMDLDNDGLYEVGKSLTSSFPPVNAPQEVHDAWEAATRHMSAEEYDSALFQTSVGAMESARANNPSAFTNGALGEKSFYTWLFSEALADTKANKGLYGPKTYAQNTALYSNMLSYL